MARIKQLRKETASPKSSRVEPAKVRIRDPKSSRVEHEPSVITTINEPSEKDPRARFKSPTVDEIEEFASENNLSLDGFFDYYESNGWKVGKNKMKNWKAAARGWHNRSKQYGVNNGTRSSKAAPRQIESPATRAHNRNKRAYEAALIEEQGDQTLCTVPSQVLSQVDFGGR